jgi:predicted thioredoxin/glutaredoxin
VPNTHSWAIHKLDCYTSRNGKNNVVREIYWWRKATSSTGATAQLYGSTSIDYDETSIFVPFDDLTPTIVESWLTGILGSEAIAELDSSLDDMLKVERAPVVVSPDLPWNG